MTGQTERYSAIRREVLEDITLTPGARSVLFYLTAKHPGWLGRDGDVTKLRGISLHKWQHDIRPELVKAGYLRVEQIKADGQFGQTETRLNRERVIYTGKG